MDSKITGIKIEYQNLAEFNFEKGEYSVFYDEENDVWYAEYYGKSIDIFQDNEIIEDKNKDIIMDETIYLFDTYMFTIEKLNEFKEVINVNR